VAEADPADDADRAGGHGAEERHEGEGEWRPPAALKRS
jgi:hypothetical protein